MKTIHRLATASCSVLLGSAALAAAVGPSVRADLSRSVITDVRASPEPEAEAGAPADPLGRMRADLASAATSLNSAEVLVLTAGGVPLKSKGPDQLLDCLRATGSRLLDGSRAMATAADLEAELAGEAFASFVSQSAAVVAGLAGSFVSPDEASGWTSDVRQAVVTDEATADILGAAGVAATFGSVAQVQDSLGALLMILPAPAPAADAQAADPPGTPAADPPGAPARPGGGRLGGHTVPRTAAPVSPAAPPPPTGHRSDSPSGQGSAPPPRTAGNSGQPQAQPGSGGSRSRGNGRAAHG